MAFADTEMPLNLWICYFGKSSKPLLIKVEEMSWTLTVLHTAEAFSQSAPSSLRRAGSGWVCSEDTPLGFRGISYTSLAITHESSKMAPNSVFSMEDFLGLNQSSSAACSGEEVPNSSSVQGYLDVTFWNLLPQSCNRKLNKMPLFLWGIYWILVILPCLMVILYGKQQIHLRYSSAFLGNVVFTVLFRRKLSGLWLFSIAGSLKTELVIAIKYLKLQQSKSNFIKH